MSFRHLQEVVAINLQRSYFLEVLRIDKPVPRVGKAQNRSHLLRCVWSSFMDESVIHQDGRSGSDEWADSIRLTDICCVDWLAMRSRPHSSCSGLLIQRNKWDEEIDRKAGTEVIDGAVEQADRIAMPVLRGGAGIRRDAAENRQYEILAKNRGEELHQRR